MQRNKSSSVEKGASSSFTVCQSLYFYVFCKSSSRFQLAQVQSKLRDALFVRVWHHSWAVVVISRSAPCVSAEVDPLPTVCCICICLRPRDAHTDPNSGFSFFFLSSFALSPVYCAWTFLLFFISAKCWCSAMPEYWNPFSFIWMSVSAHTHTHARSRSLPCSYTLVQYLTKHSQCRLSGEIINCVI